ncbi:MAG: HAMP domain-containing sensor histidine kinase [Candidatus Berkelbacteria bacterium]|nr:HAMP domain-containing sensor histidine kinase [Candidatus Berkelbacteria bacterium]
MAISISFSVAIYNISTFEVGRGVGRTFKVVNLCAPEHLPPGFENLEHARIQQIEEISAHLKNNLFYFNFVILVISSALSYFLAKKTLHPLELAMDSQNRFTADASHELRTPLAAMRAEIDVALRDKKMTLGEAKKLLNSNIEEIKKLEALSDSLIKLAQYQNTKNDFADLDISNILVEAYEKVEVLAKKKNIVFENDIKGLNIKGDKQALVNLFVILIDNAIKYSSKNSKIKIETIKKEKHVIIKISDGGSGIKQEDLPHIFDRFYRADTSRNKEKINGFGLGLSIAKNIVEFHNGKISAKSKEGEGSEFTIIL